ncbi:MAG: hypothetical protein H0X13_15575 [Ramlibacter sp.]|nr:hypothetical protein [Ramlibacter sp.]
MQDHELPALPEHSLTKGMGFGATFFYWSAPKVRQAQREAYTAGQRASLPAAQPSPAPVQAQQGVTDERTQLDSAWMGCRAERDSPSWTVAEVWTYRGFFEHGWQARAALSSAPTVQSEPSPKARAASLAFHHLNAIRELSVLTGQSLKSLDLARSILAYTFDGNTVEPFPTVGEFAAPPPAPVLEGGEPVAQMIREAYADAARLVEMDDPRTGDWMWGDRSDLAREIFRRGEESAKNVSALIAHPAAQAATEEAKAERDAILSQLDVYIPENGDPWDAVNEICALIAKRGEAA